MKSEFIRAFSHIGTGFRNWDRHGVSVNNRSVLAVLADGVGGHISGGVAADMAVDKFRSIHQNGGFDPGRINYYFRKLASEMRNVNEEMATTIVLIYIFRRGEKLELFYTWAGDSRLYLLTSRNRRLKKGAKAWGGDGRNLYILSEDDTIPWKYFMNGEIGLDQVTQSSSKNRLFFSLPRDGDRMKGRIVKTGISMGDQLLLCSDGFWERFEQQADISSWMDVKPAGFGKKFTRFMNTGLNTGSRLDNTTVIRIDVNKGLFDI